MRPALVGMTVGVEEVSVEVVSGVKDASHNEHSDIQNHS